MGLYGQHGMSKNSGVVYAWNVFDRGISYYGNMRCTIVVVLGSMEWSCEMPNILDSVERSWVAPNIKTFYKHQNLKQARSLDRTLNMC